MPTNRKPEDYQLSNSEAEDHFRNLPKEDFVKSAASFMNGLNMLHPFREGNGRTQRIFIEQLADHAGYNLDLSKVSKNIMIQASILAEKGKTTGLEKIIGDNIDDKVQHKEQLHSPESVKAFVKQQRSVETPAKSKEQGRER